MIQLYFYRNIRIKNIYTLFKMSMLNTNKYHKFENAKITSALLNKVK